MRKGNALDTLHRSSPSLDPTLSSYSLPQTVLKAEGLVKIYGKRRVVDGVSFHVNRGEIVGLLGPNGAGKTTSFRMTCGLISTNGGIVYLGDQDVTNWPMYRRSREGGMGYLPQEKSVFQKLSVQNNLLAVMEMIGMGRAERKRRCDELLEKLQLTHLRYNYANGLSGGERRRLEIARALVSDPKIILLDEPFAAVDPITVSGIQAIIEHLAGEGISILITDHSVQDTLQITHRSYVIEAGRVLCHGTPAEVLSNPEARKAYFGDKVSVSQIGGDPSVAGHFSSADHDVSPSTVIYRETSESGGASRIIGRRKSNPDTPKTATGDSKPTYDDYDPEWDTRRPPRASRPAERTAERREGETRPHRKHDASGHPYSSGARHAQQEPPTDSSHRSIDSQATPSESSRSRTVGKRLAPTSRITLPERPLVQSDRPTPPQESSVTDDPASGMSGIIRSLGSLIWKKDG